MNKSIIGRKFGRLTVVARDSFTVSKGGYLCYKYRCVCDCGTDNIVVSASGLYSGHTKSCGCLRKELSAARLEERRKK